MNVNHEDHPRCGVSRRNLLKGAAGAMAVAAALPAASLAAERRRRPLVVSAQPAAGKAATKGHVNHSVCAWCFEKHWNLETLCQHAVALGIKSVELVDPKDFPMLKKYGLVCALTNSHGFEKGFNNKEHHEWAADILRKQIDACAAAGCCPTVITFSGFRKGIPDDVGLENTVEGLKKVVGYAEEKKVNLCIEVLNSRVPVEMKGHPDYQCDKVEWAAEVCKRIASPRMTLLFDVYHVQVMEGDLIARIKQYHEFIGHYHVAGVPGRNELDENQEVNYPAVLKAIVATGYKGYVAQEFIPTRDPLQSLREAVEACDV
jgi:hydroxypyruvate isomerase